MRTVDRVVVGLRVLRQTGERSWNPFDDELRFLRNDGTEALNVSDFDELVSSVGMSDEMVVRSDKCGREYPIWSLLPSVLDGPRCIASQPERDANLLMFEDSDFALLSGVELGSGLPSVLGLTAAPNVEHQP